jgi:hypothetical protein
MNTFSSTISNDHGEVGGFAIIFFKILYFENKNKYGFEL